jgi:mannose-6-phosphate isomerase
MYQLNQPKVVSKPWGREEWIELNEFYCKKRLFVNAGHQTSLQYHLKKVETNTLISGVAYMVFVDGEGKRSEVRLKPRQSITIHPPQIHRLVAVTDIELLEVSTPQIDDVVRVEDDTHRGNGRIESEHAEGKK